MRGTTVSLRAVFLFALFPAGAFAQINLAVNPQQVSLVASAGSAAPATQTVTVVSTATNLSYNATVRYISSATGWLSVTPATGSVPATLTISADPSKLTPGTYVGQVTITAGVLGAFVNVFFTVGPGPGPGGGGLVVNPSGLTFIGQFGLDILPEQTVTLATTSGSPVRFSAFATSSGNWLNVSPPSGNAPGTLTVLAIQTGLSPGTRTGSITITPATGGAPVVIPVVLVTLGAGVASPVLSLSQNALTFNHQLGVSTPPVQTVGVVATDTVRVFTATATTTTGGDWLRLSTATQTSSTSISGFTPLDFSVQVSPAALAPGSYSGTITVESFPVPPIALPVTLTVSSGTALNAVPSSVTFSYLIGDLVPGPRAVTVTATGSGGLSFTTAIAPGAPWLDVTPASGSTTGNSQQLSISVNPAGLVAGLYTGTVVFSLSSGTTLNIPVVLNVTGSLTESTIDIPVTSVTMTGLVGGANPTQTADINTSIFGATHPFTAVASSNEGWLNVTPFSTTAPTKITLTANSAAVRGPGTYTGSVIITSLATGAQSTIAVTFTLALRAIIPQPASLSFTQTQRGVAPPPQTIQITANTVSSVAASTQTPWIKVQPLRGSAPATLTVSVDPAGLAAGSVNTGSITVAGPDNTLTISVSLKVLDPPAPTTTPNSITLAYELGSPAPKQTLDIGATETVTLNFTVSVATESGVKWLVVTPTSGTTPATITVTLDPTQLVPGQHKGSITVAFTNGSPPTVVSVTLTVTAAKVAIQQLLHGATFATTPIAPGQLVTIMGTGLGPVTGVVARPTSAGAFETRMADIRVLFDGVPAPLLFVRIDQINAIVPYELHARLSARVQIESGTSLSIPIEVKVVDAAPGLFTNGGSGRGQAAALNVDLTANSVLNPAPRGTVIALFGTGEGQTDPPGNNGRVIASDLRRPLLRVTAKIAGRPAEVTYAGSASGLVSGIFQANVRIPEDIDAGIVPIEIQVGDAPTQSGVTIAVR